MLNKEDEQEVEYLQSRQQVKTRTFTELAADLPRLMMNLSLPSGQVQMEQQDAAAIQIYSSKRKLTNSHEDQVKEGKRQKFLEHLGKKIEALRITNKEEYTRDFTSLPSDILLFILDKLLEPIDHARFAAVGKQWQSLVKQYNCETKPWLRVLTPMLLIPTQSHGSDDLTTMLYSVTERKIYRNFKLPVPGDDTIYCGFGWMAKLQYPDKSPNGSLGITLTNPFRSTEDVIRLPPIPRVWSASVKPAVKIILPTDPALDRENYVVLAICDYSDESILLLIRRGQTIWDCYNPRKDRRRPCSAATYYEGRVFSLLGSGIKRLICVTKHHHPDQIVGTRFKLVAYLDDEHCTGSLLVQTYLVTSTKGDLLVVKRLLERKEKLRFEVFRVDKSISMVHDEVFKITEVDNIGDEAIFVGCNQSVCVSASKFAGYVQPNSVYYTNDVVVDGKRSEGIGIFNLEDGTVKQLCPRLEGNKVQAIWITPAFPEC